MIKDQIENFITQEEADQLRALWADRTLNSKAEYGNLKNRKGVERDIAMRFAEMVSVTPHDQAYVRLSHKPEGHKWHKDTGTKNHMPWCSYGGSILLSRDYEFVGGGFHYREGEIEQPHLSLTYHTSDVEHMVQPHQGIRMVFLMFI